MNGLNTGKNETIKMIILYIVVKNYLSLLNHKPPILLLIICYII
jgi:hypothetical protein